jgi:Uma2 family endonuclease
MDEQKEQENMDYYLSCLPESKMELVDGRLLVGNGLAGSRLLLDHILRGWGVDAAVALASNELWLEAVCKAFHLEMPESFDDDVLKILEEKATKIDYVFEDLTPGANDRGNSHWLTRSHLQICFYQVSDALGGEVYGRDVVIRLGENGFTPDVFFFNNKTRSEMYEYYLGCPAEFIIEVTTPSHKFYDTHIKREYYARAGVPEYLIVDAKKKEFEFLRLVNDDYVSQPLDADGLYRPQSVQGLAIDPKFFFRDEKDFSSRGEHNPFIVEQAQPSSQRTGREKEGLGWGDLAFEPRIGLEPVSIRFDEYICWCPESKFEFWDGKIQICGIEGVRNVLGLLLMTFGLVDVCKLASPIEWVSAVRRKQESEKHDPTVREEWWTRAIEAAKQLRKKFNLKRIAITGDLLSPNPLNYWSRLTLAVWDLKTKDWHDIYEVLSPMNINFEEADDKYFQKKIKNGQITFEEI